MKQYYPIEGKAVSKRLQNKSTSACINRARYLNLQVTKNTDSKVKCIETGRVFNSHQEASEWLGFNKTAVRHAISKNTTCGGLHWEYITE